MFEALTDLYSILPLGVKGKRMVPLLKKRRPAAAQGPGLTGAALDDAVKRFVSRVPHSRGSRLN